MKTPIAVAITAAATAVVVGVGAFYGGMLFGRNQVTAQRAARFGANGAAGARRSGFATGTVLSADASSVTVKLASGGSQTIYLAPTTRMTRSQDATASDLKAGENVIVTGQADSGGQVTARSIQIVPAGFRGALGPGGFGGGGQGGFGGGTGTNGGGNAGGTGGTGGNTGGGQGGGGFGGPPD